jgi:dihydroceramidase
MFLELHGWWHIFTGIGAYIGMALCEYLITLDGDGEGFAWPVRSVLQELDSTEVKKAR